MTFGKYHFGNFGKFCNVHTLNTRKHCGKHFLLTIAAFGIGKPIFEYISDLMSSSPVIGEAAGVLIRVIGIAVITRISADMCREMGAANIASSLETVAKFEIILLSLPLVSTVLESVRALFSEAGL